MTGTFDNNSSNPGDTVSGTLALQTGNSLTLETRNLGAVENGSIDLTGSAHAAALTIVTSGAGTITINSGVGGDQDTNITLPGLTSASAIDVDAGGGTSSSVFLNGILTGGAVNTTATGNVTVGNPVKSDGTVDSAKTTKIASDTNGGPSLADRDDFCI